MCAHTHHSEKTSGTGRQPGRLVGKAVAFCRLILDFSGSAGIHSTLKPPSLDFAPASSPTQTSSEDQAAGAHTLGLSLGVTRNPWSGVVLSTDSREMCTGTGAMLWLPATGTV